MNSGIKPPHGEPCNRCGICCQVTMCPIGAAVFKRKVGPCPAIERDADDFPSCGLVEHPKNYVPGRVARYGAGAVQEAALLMTAAGHGCDCYFVGEATSPAFYSRMNEQQRLFPEKYAKARAIFFNPNFTSDGNINSPQD